VEKEREEEKERERERAEKLGVPWKVPKGSDA
jgi:hypothetical protein